MSGKRSKAALGMLVAAAGAVAASSPYLPAIGPPALRFQLPVSAVTNRPDLPPLPSPLPSTAEDSEAALGTSPTNSLSVSNAEVAVAKSPPPLLVPFLQTTNSVPVLDSDEPTQAAIMEPPLITPDLILKYFTPISNGPSTVVAIPGAVAPGPAVFVPPSRAAYSIIP
jgi:hypothetical protein